jgi:hypothetical protein
MRSRNTYLWAVGTVAVFMAVLVFQGGPNITSGAVTSASAPAVPSAWFETGAVAQGVPSHFDGCGPALRAMGRSFALRVIPRVERAQQVEGATRPVYAPLHRRPPPSFS